MHLAEHVRGPEGLPPRSSSLELNLVTALAERSDAVRSAVEKLLKLESPAAFLHEQKLVLTDGGLEVPAWTLGATYLSAAEASRRSGFQLFNEARYAAFRNAFPAVDAVNTEWLSDVGHTGFAKFGGTRNEKVYIGEAGITRPYSKRGYRRTWATPIEGATRPSIEKILARFRDQVPEAK